MDYIINPVMMGGIIKEVKEDKVKIRLHGRLGVITVPTKLIKTDNILEMGPVLEFYFSYIQVMEDPYEYDSSDIFYEEMQPCLLGGKITQVNDTAIEDVEFYLSHMRVIGKKKITLARA